MSLTSWCRYVKLNLAIFHHILSACNSTSVEAIHYPNKILKFGLLFIHMQSLKRQLQLLSKCSIK